MKFIDFWVVIRMAISTALFRLERWLPRARSEWKLDCRPMTMPRPGRNLHALATVLKEALHIERDLGGRQAILRLPWSRTSRAG